MTIAKYYIPSGRLIQAIDYSHRNADGSVGRIPDSLTTVWHTRAGREVRDGGGITPRPQGRAARRQPPALQHNPRQLGFDFANRYAATHDTIPPAEQFEVTDTIFNEFKAFINPDKFKYDRTTDLIMEQLEKAVKTEGYLDTAVQAQMDTLKNLLRHDLNHDLDLNRKAISQYLAGEIVERYYSERGGIIQALKTDIELDSAAAVLHSPERYRRILAPVKH